jgi:hypothetical protein
MILTNGWRSYLFLVDGAILEMIYKKKIMKLD